MSNGVTTSYLLIEPFLNAQATTPPHAVKLTNETTGEEFVYICKEIREAQNASAN